VVVVYIVNWWTKETSSRRGTLLLANQRAARVSHYPTDRQRGRPAHQRRVRIADAPGRFAARGVNLQGLLELCDRIVDVLDRLVVLAVVRQLQHRAPPADQRLLGGGRCRLGWGVGLGVGGNSGAFWTGQGVGTHRERRGVGCPNSCSAQRTRRTSALVLSA